MKPYKHVALTDREQDIFNLAIVRLRTASGDIPVVCTCEFAHLAISVWNPGVTNWDNPDSLPKWQRAVAGPDSREFWEYYHYTLLAVEPRAYQPVRDMSDIRSFWWSQTVGIAAVDNHIFLVYKRLAYSAGPGSWARLFIDRFAYDEATGLLQHDQQFQVPFGYSDAAGFHLWCGYSADAERLAVLVQSKDSLDLLAIAKDNLGADLSLAASWQPPLTVGSGGYDLDAVLQGQTLFCVYRAEPDAIRGSHSSGWPGEDYNHLFDDSIYSPLTVSTINLATSEVENIAKEVPGGFSPQIQSTEPLTITVDRIEKDTLNMESGSSDDGRDFVRATPSLESFQKIVLRKTGERWARGRLFTLLAQFRSRRLQYENQSYPMISVSRDESGQLTVNLSLLNPTNPAFLTRQLQVSDKIAEIDLVFHSQMLGALVVCRYAINTSAEDLEPKSQAFAILDINHGQITLPGSYEKSASAENAQFHPFSAEPEPTGYERDNCAYELECQSATFDNTIGGCLVMERGTGSLAFYAYTDLGDGGCRLIFDEELPTPKQQQIVSPKLLHASAVPGPGSSENTWLRLTDNSEWRPSDLPGYLIGPVVDLDTWNVSRKSIGSGPQVHLDLLDFIVGGDSFTESDALRCQNQLHNRMLEESDGRSVSSEDDSVTLTIYYKPVDPFAGSAIQFRASLAGNPSEALQFSWNLGSDLPLQFGPAVSGTFNETGDHAVSLTVSFMDGTSLAASEQVTVRESIWDQLWKPLDVFNECLGNNVLESVRLCDTTIQLSKYKLTFVHSSGGGRKKIIKNNLDSHDSECRFRSRGPVQGAIHYRLKMSLESSDVRTSGFVLRLICNVDRLSFLVNYGRVFTPGILMSDQRTHCPVTDYLQISDTLQDKNHRFASALTAKPNGSTSVSVTSIESSISLTGAVYIPAVIIAALTELGFLALARSIIDLVAIVESSTVMPWVALIAAIILAYLVFFVMPDILRGYLNDRLRERLSSPKLKTGLDQTRIMRYAGEGLAESLARAAIAKAIDEGVMEETEAVSADEDGLVRFREHLWQMVFVTEGECHLLLRT